MKLLALTVNHQDSTSFYRASGVFGDLQKRMDVDITVLDFSDIRNFSWATLMMYDVVFIQRPFTSLALRLSKMIRGMNIPLWIDFDDNLLEIPIDNPSYELFSSEDTKKSIIGCTAMASVVSVSTEALKQAISEWNENVVVIPNALNMELLGSPKRQSEERIIAWRGSNTHTIDLFLFKNQIMSAMSEYQNTNFVFMGYNAWMIPALKNKKHIPTVDPIIFFQHLGALAPYATFVPLDDNKFNRCKSNIAWLEATWAGAVGLVPDWQEWDHPGAITYSSVEDFGQKLNKLLAGEFNEVKLQAEAWKWIEKNRTLKKVNSLRVDLLKKITK